MSTATPTIKVLNVDEIRTDHLPEGSEEIQAEFNAAHQYVQKHGGDILDHLSPRAIFADFTLMHAQGLEQRISQRCKAKGAVPFFGDHPNYGRVMYAMLIDGYLLKKNIFEHFDTYTDQQQIGPVVYFIEAVGIDRVKIGYSHSHHSRLHDLRRGSPVPLRLMATVEGGPDKERELHRKFSKHRTHGEWFMLTGEIREYVEGLK